MDRGAWWATVPGVAVLNTKERLTLSFFFSFFCSEIQRLLLLFFWVKLDTRAGVLCVFLQPLFMGKDSEVTKRVKEDL